MSADGSVEVLVSAEGADAAAEDLSDASGTEMAGGGETGGRLGGGKFGKLLGLIGGIIAILGPMVDLLDAATQILAAFLAPIGLIVTRLLAPVLRQLVRLLPLWFSFIDAVAPLIRVIVTLLTPLVLLFTLAKLIQRLAPKIWSRLQTGFQWVVRNVSALPGNIWQAINSGAAWFADGANAIGRRLWADVKGLPDMIWSRFESGWAWFSLSLTTVATAIGAGVWSFMSQLPEQIGREIAERLPSVPTRDEVAGDVSDRANDVLDRVREGGTNVTLSGGLGTFVDRVEKDPNVDLP